MDKQLLGMYGEIISSRYLREHGYRVVSANYSCRLGEIDLIVEDRKHICFVEVKTRSENMKYAPADAVDSAKRKKIIATSQLFAKENKITATIHKASEGKKRQSKPRTVKISDEKQKLFAEILSNLEYDYGKNVEILKENKLIQVKIGEKVFKIDLIEQRQPKK
jgi:putative endonuclease